MVADELIANVVYYLLCHFVLLTNVLSLFPTWLSSVPALILIMSNLYWELTIDFLYLESRDCDVDKKECGCGGLRSAIKEIAFPQMTNVMLKTSQVIFPFTNKIVNVFFVGFHVMVYLATRDTKYCVTHKFRWLSHNNKLVILSGFAMVVLNQLTEMFIWKFLFIHDTWFTRFVCSHMAWIITFYLFVIVSPSMSFTKHDTHCASSPFKYPFYSADLFYNDMLRLIKFIIMNFNWFVSKIRSVDDQLINELIVLLKTRTVKDYLRSKAKNEGIKNASFGASAVRFVQSVLFTEKKVRMIECAVMASPTAKNIKVNGEMFVLLL